MAYKNLKKLLTAEELIKKVPLSDVALLNIVKHRQEIENILSNKDSRMLVIIGPCSAWPYAATLEYAQRLLHLNEKISSKIKLVMRTYIQKPRTIKGWTGPLNQPDPTRSADIEEGMLYARSLMVKISEMGLAIADEALFTHNSRGFVELLSWIAIGARSSEDQEHRIHASSLDCPVGIKNPTHGSIKIGVNGVIAAQHSHTALFDGDIIETSGNRYAHLVLRGGNNATNYDNESLTDALKYLTLGNVQNPAIIVDVSHDNCLVNGKKEYKLQGQIALKVLEDIKLKPELKSVVKGFMLESFIKDGNQAVIDLASVDMNGLSITDPCIGWESTEEFLLQLAKNIE